jgi:antitoxin component of MazEF toxin-antitoxin module
MSEKTAKFTTKVWLRIHNYGLESHIRIPAGLVRQLKLKHLDKIQVEVTKVE